MKSLKLKMLLVLLPIILLALAVISGIGYFFARQVIQKNMDEILSETAYSSANKIEGWLNVQLQIINSSKTTLEEMGLSSADELSYLSAILESNPNFSDVYIGTKDGVMIDGSGWTPRQIMIQDNVIGTRLEMMLKRLVSPIPISTW